MAVSWNLLLNLPGDRLLTFLFQGRFKTFMGTMQNNHGSLSRRTTELTLRIEHTYKI
jgi:hypothetical protein